MPSSSYIAHGSDPYEYGLYPGDVEIRVDRYTGRSSYGYGDPTQDKALAQVAWEEWNYPIHAGIPFNPGWRLLWIVFGLTPLLLAITGTVTWWIRRKRRRRKGTLKPIRPAPEANSA